MTLRPDEELSRALAELAAAEGVPQSEVVRRAVLERHHQWSRAGMVDSAYRRISTRRREVLDRLGDS